MRVDPRVVISLFAQANQDDALSGDAMQITQNQGAVCGAREFSFHDGTDRAIAGTINDICSRAKHTVCKDADR
jgi:hypothetical protein